MTENFRNLIDTKRNPASVKDETHSDEVIVDADEREVVSSCFSMVSADRMRKLMLELRFQTGNSQAFAYSYLLAAAFDPSDGILLDFGGKTVTIAGWNLRPLYDALVAQRVAWVRELDSPHAEVTVPKGETAVSRIEVAEPT